MTENVIVRISPNLQSAFRRRGVFPELQGSPAIPCPINVIVTKEKASELLQDAEAQHKVVSGSEKKAACHFIRQLDRVLETPAYLLYRRIEEEREAARQRAQGWIEKLKSSKFGKSVVDAVWCDTERWKRELDTHGSINGHSIDKDVRKEVSVIIDRLLEARLEESLGWRLDSATFVLIDETIEKARRARS